MLSNGLILEIAAQHRKPDETTQITISTSERLKTVALGPSLCSWMMKTIVICIPWTFLSTISSTAILEFYDNALDTEGKQ